jgi:hypothetical protein
VTGRAGISPRVKRLAPVLAVLVVAAAAPAAALGADLPAQTLRSGGQTITWHGQSADPTGQGYGPPTAQTCTSDTCDTLMLDVELPPGSLPKGPRDPAPQGMSRVQAEGPTDMPGDGVLISIKWATDFDQWNLYVDDMSTGRTVAQAFNLDSNAQSVLLSRPHNGMYRIRVVPFYTSFDKADARYTGEARVFHDATQRAPGGTRLLPRLQTVAPNNFHLADIPPVVSNPTGWRYTPNGTFANSCYLDETQQFGSTRCLRFDNDIRNVGEGPLVLRFDYTPDAFTGHCNMRQDILASDATVSERDAGPCNFHTQHGHFHYQNMGRYQLFAVDARGRPADKPVAASNKVGFCTIDVDDYGFGTSAARPRTYSFPTCNIPNGTSPPTSTPYGPGGAPEFMGITQGWGDIYTWDLPQQYIDVSHVPDGTYEVVSRTNPDGGILTSDRGQETGVSCVEMHATAVKVLREFPSQPNAAPLPRCADEPVVAKAKKHKARKHKAKKRHKRRAKHHRRRAKHHARHT